MAPRACKIEKDGAGSAVSTAIVLSSDEEASSSSSSEEDSDGSTFSDSDESDDSSDSSDSDDEPPSAKKKRKSGTVTPAPAAGPAAAASTTTVAAAAGSTTTPKKKSTPPYWTKAAERDLEKALANPILVPTRFMCRLTTTARRWLSSKRMVPRMTKELGKKYGSRRSGTTSYDWWTGLNLCRDYLTAPWTSNAGTRELIQNWLDGCVALTPAHSPLPWPCSSQPRSRLALATIGMKATMTLDVLGPNLRSAPGDFIRSHSDCTFPPRVISSGRAHSQLKSKHELDSALAARSIVKTRHTESRRPAVAVSIPVRMVDLLHRRPRSRRFRQSHLPPVPFAVQPTPSQAALFLEWIDARGSAMSKHEFVHYMTRYSTETITIEKPTIAADASDESDSFTQSLPLFVKHVDGRTIVLDDGLTRGDSGRKLQERIATATGLPIDSFHLSHGGRPLVASSSLAQLAAESTIHVSLRLLGGSALGAPPVPMIMDENHDNGAVLPKGADLLKKRKSPEDGDDGDDESEKEKEGPPQKKGKANEAHVILAEDQAAAAANAAPAASPARDALPDLPPFVFPKNIDDVADLPSSVVEAIRMLIIVINKNEFQGLFRVLEPLTSNKGRFLKAKILGVTVYVAQMGQHVVAVAQSAVSNQTVNSISNTIHSLLGTLQPVAVVNLGVAFGAKPSKQKLGDVLISNLMVDYSSIRVNEDGTITERGARPEAGKTLMRHCLAASNEVDYTTTLGVIVSGPELVDNFARREQLVARVPDAIGGEMEGIGLYTASAHFSVEWILIKAICDWADGSKQKAWQPFAALRAAQFLQHVLSSQFVFKDFPVFNRKPLPAVISHSIVASSPLAPYMAPMLTCLRPEFSAHPPDVVQRVIINQDSAIMHSLQMQTVPRIGLAAPMDRAECISKFHSDVVKHLDKLLDHASRFKPETSDVCERAVIFAVQIGNCWPTLYIFLLRLGSESAEVFDLVVLPDENRYMSEEASKQVLDTCLPPYPGDAAHATDADICEWLIDQDIPMTDWSADETNQVLKAREWLRRCCTPGRLLSDAGTSAGMASIAQKWLGDYTEIAFISNGAMKIALVSQGYRVKLDGSMNLRANMILLQRQ